jgi:hypothetical protein
MRVSAKEAAKRTRERLKKVLPDCKFSIRTDGSTIYLSLMEAPFEAMENDHDGYEQVNHYLLTKYESFEEFDKGQDGCRNRLTPECWEVLRVATLTAMIDREDHSEPQVDCFYCNFYVEVAVGRWDRPFRKR